MTIKPCSADLRNRHSPGWTKRGDGVIHNIKFQNSQKNIHKYTRKVDVPWVQPSAHIIRTCYLLPRQPEGTQSTRLYAERHHLNLEAPTKRDILSGGVIGLMVDPVLCYMLCVHCMLLCVFPLDVVFLCIFFALCHPPNVWWHLNVHILFVIRFPYTICSCGIVP